MQPGGAPLSSLSLPEIIDGRAASQGDKIVLRFLANGEEESAHLSYADLARRSRALAGEVSRLAGPGERAVLAFPAGLDFIVAFVACLYAGVIAVPVETPSRRSGGARLAAIAKSSVARLFLTHSAARDLLPDLGAPWRLSDALEDAGGAARWTAPFPKLGDIAYLQYTSGSTQSPRGVAISHRALSQQLDLYRTRDAGGWRDLILVGWLPHTHDFGLVGFLLSALFMGTPLIFMPPTAFLRRPLRWLEAISAYRGSYCGGPNFGYELCASAGAKALTGAIDLSCWRIASLGGDPIAPQTLQRFAAAFAPFGFREEAWLPAYGLAESVLCASGRRGAEVRAFDAASLRESKARPAVDGAPAIALVSCGAPMPGQRLRIVDPTSAAPVADGAVGEIWLAGDSLAEGYWNDAPATQAQFGATLASGGCQTRYLRTGDCGFIDAGELFVTGRLKDVIILHGKNHAPEDIEATAQSVHPALRWGCGAVVQTSLEAGSEIALIQEATRSESFDPATLFQAIARAVSERCGVALDAIELIRAGTLPRTRSGKICRREARAAFETASLRRLAEWRRPRAGVVDRANEINTRLIAELKRTLNVPEIDPDQNLFELGLDSLAIQWLIGRVEAIYGTSLPIETLFETPTVSALAACVAGRQRATSVAPRQSEEVESEDLSLPEARQELARLRALVEEQSRRIDELSRRGFAPVPPSDFVAPTREDAAVPLNETQREIKLLAELRPAAAGAFNNLIALEHHGPLDVEALRSALRRLASRHEALRLSIEDDAQRVHDAIDIELSQCDFDDIAALREWLVSERRRPFAIDRAPLWRASLLRQGARVFLVLTAHHLALDGASLPILVENLAACLAGKEAMLPPPASFRRFCAQLAKRRSAADDEKHRRFWRHALGDTLPDFAPPGKSFALRAPDHESATHGFALDARMRSALVRVGAEAKATLFHTLLAAFFVLLHRVSGQERIAIGVDAANRSTAEEQAVVGCCNTLVPVVVDFSEAFSARALIARVRESMLDAIAHRDYTLAMWARDARIAPDLTRPFKIVATLNMQRFPTRCGGFTPRFDLERPSLSQSPFGLSLDIRDGDDGAQLDFVFNKQIFAADCIVRYGAYYLRLLHAIARDASADIFALPLLSEAEAGQLLSFGRSGTPPAPYSPFLRRFDDQVAATPNAEAICCASKRFTYRELQLRANAMAQAIASKAAPGSVVALLALRSSDFLAAMLAIFRTGCVYLPLDPKDPDARLHDLIARADVALLLHDAAHKDVASALQTLCSEPLSSLDIEAGQDPAIAAAVPDSICPSAESLAYLFFTSGTTGAPKAAQITQGGMVNHLNAKIDALQLSAADRLAQTAPQSFDISVWQFLAPLLCGARLSVFSDETTHDPRALFDETQRQAITILEVVPSVLRPAIDILQEPGSRRPLKALRWLMSTGEALPASICRRWISLYPEIPVINAYGPTECSDDVTHQVVEWPPAPEVARIPIGRPIPGATLYVLDRSGGLAPPGAMGELYVGGICVGRGYRNDQERTRAAFVPNPFAKDSDERLYRTGDLVRFLDDGALEYLGRIDQQIKLNGVRIEPREIEAAIQRDPAVAQSIVSLHKGADGKERLVAHVLFRPGMTSTAGALKAAARKTLPPALTPSRFLFLDAIPLNANGKIDTARLPPPGASSPRAEPAPPATPLEATLLDIWSATMAGAPKFGVNDDFFELGGCSMNAATIAKEIEKRLCVRVPVSAIFRAPTIVGLAGAVERLAAQQNEYRNRTGIAQ